jgi:gliding motility-associated-like protein
MATFSWSNGTSGKNMITNALGKHYVIAQVAFCYDRDTFTLTNFPSELELGNDLRFCNKIDTLITSPSNKFKTVVWNNEVTNTNFRLTKPGRLHITVVNSNGCIEKDSINIQLFPNPALNLGPDTTLCLSEKPRLNAGPGMVSYLWNTGSNKQEIIAYDSGQYWVEVIDIEGCKSVDSVLIIKRKDLFPIDIYMPSAFTPNGDELNDVYPNSQYQVEGAEYNVKLFNRWGEKLAEFNNPTLNWDGNINGQEAPEGVYVYTITWVGCDNVRRTLYGDFLLMR